MKKFFIGLLLLAGGTVAGQSRGGLPDSTFLTTLKEIGPVSESVRNHQLKMLDERLSEMTDESPYRSSYIAYRQDLTAMEFGNAHTKHIDSLSKMDMKGLKRSWDEFKMHYLIEAKNAKFSPLSPFLIVDGLNVYLKLAINYRGSDWLFMSRASIMTDEDLYDINFDRNVKQDVFSGSTVKEWVYLDATPRIMAMMRNISTTSGDVKIRLEGEKYIDRKLTGTQVDDIRRIVSAYDKLKKVEN
ncbi:hypothetical protein [Sphingobacterium sp.]|uniref:hypothetical protein n=1 Tax=Sphingobacterium sp. TaxID=341027 RepID=UPI0028AF3473|nr:hypothetical protein [Sphingobacterium sp.]